MVQPGDLTVARYHAFVSYSHTSDGGFAPEFQHHLEAFARSGRAMRAIRVFRDEANLAADPDLWHGIEQALSASEWLVLLASPPAAASPGVGREIQWWLANRSTDRILIGLTDGELVWDQDTGDFTSSSSAVHPALRGALVAEPRWIDLRGVRSLPKIDDDDPRVQEALAEFAAPLRGVAKDELIGEHHRRRQRERRRIRNALVLFVVLFLVAAVAGVLAYVQGQRAAEEARVATARLLSATAARTSSVDAGSANLLAVEGYRLRRDSQTVSALFQVVNDNPGLVRQHAVAAPVSALVAAPSGVVLAGTTDGRLIRWNPRTDTTSEARLGRRPVTDIASSDDGMVTAASDGQRSVVWGSEGKPVALDQPHADLVAVSPDGNTVVVLTDPDSPVSRLGVFAASNGARRADVTLPDEYWFQVGMPDEQTVAMVGGSGVWQRLRLADLTVTTAQKEGLFPPSRGIHAMSDNGSFTGVYAGWATVFDTGGDGGKVGYSGVDSAFVPEIFTIRRDGKRVAASGGGRLFISDVTGVNGQHNGVELLGAGGAEQVAFVGESDKLVTANGATLSLWDLDQRSRLRRDGGALNVPETPAASAQTRMAVAPDGHRVLVIGGFGDVVLHDLRRGPSAGVSVPVPLRDEQFPGSGEFIPDWLPDGTPVLIEKVGCALFAIRGDTLEPMLESSGAENVAAQVSADGELLSCVSVYGGLTNRRLGDDRLVADVPGTDEPMTASSGNLEVGMAAISDDGRYAAWINGLDDSDGRLTVADSVERRTVTVSGRSEAVYFAGDRLLVSHADGSLDVRDPTGANLIRRIPGGIDYARPLAWVPGTPFVGRLRDDGTVTVFDVDSATLLGSLPVPTGRTSATDRWGATALVGSEATGELLAASPLGTVARWALNEHAWVELACAFAGRDLDAAEWQEVTGSDPPEDLRCRR